MGNCLVTKLKECVVNENLTFLGKIRVPVNNSNGRKSAIRVSSYNSINTTTLTIGDGSFYYYQQDTPGTSNIIAPSYDEAIVQYIANSDTYIDISKYNLMSFGVPQYNTRLENNVLVVEPTGKIPTNWSIDLSEFSYTPHLRRIYGDMNVIKGNLLDLSKCTELSYIRLCKGSVSGDLTKLVKGIVENGGPATGSFSFELDIVNTGDDNNMNITFGRVKMLDSNLTPQNVNWESATKVWIKPSFYDGVYCVGYTDEEIATNIASGGIWEGKTVTKCD